MLDFCISKNISLIKILKGNGANTEPQGIPCMNCASEILLGGTIFLLQGSLAGLLNSRSIRGVTSCFLRPQVKLKVGEPLSETFLRIVSVLKRRDSRMKANMLSVHRLDFSRTDNFQVHSKGIKSTITTPISNYYIVFFFDHESV